MIHHSLWETIVTGEFVRREGGRGRLIWGGGSRGIPVYLQS